MNTLLYLYGYVPDDASLPEQGLAGIDGRPVELLPVDVFQAAVSRVSAETYDPERLEPRLKDLGWVAERGLRHEEVVAWFVDHAQITPVRLFTLYSSPDALREETAERAGEIRREMRRLGGLRQWDLKVSYAADRLTERLAEVSDEVAELDRRIEQAEPGRRFLLEKKRDGVVRREVAAAARRLAGELLDELRPLADDTVRVPLPEKAAELPVVLSAALLLDAEGESQAGRRVEQRAAELERLGVHVDFTGPWAPYRFVAAAQA